MDEFNQTVELEQEVGYWEVYKSLMNGKHRRVQLLVQKFTTRWRSPKSQLKLCFFQLKWRPL